MINQKRKISIFIISIILILIYIQLPKKAYAQNGTIVEQTEEDIRIIPDK